MAFSMYALAHFHEKYVSLFAQLSYQIWNLKHIRTKFVLSAADTQLERCVGEFGVGGWLGP